MSPGRRGGCNILADASEEVTETVEGVVYVFDKEGHAEKLRAADSSLRPTDLLDLSQAKLDTVVKECHQ